MRYLNYKTLTKCVQGDYIVGALFNTVFISVLVLLREASRLMLSNIAVSYEHETIIAPWTKSISLR